jgi:hypothetical protein
MIGCSGTDDRMSSERVIGCSGIRIYGYFHRERVAMILQAIEHHYQSNSAKSEPLMSFDWSQVQIEHIMPRSWEQNWPLPAELPPAVRNATIQNIGNLKRQCASSCAPTPPVRELTCRPAATISCTSTCPGIHPGSNSATGASTASFSPLPAARHESPVDPALGQGWRLGQVAQCCPVAAERADPHPGAGSQGAALVEAGVDAGAQGPVLLFELRAAGAASGPLPRAAPSA